MKRRTFIQWLWLLLFERRALRAIDRYIRVGDSVAEYWVGPGGNNGNDGLTRSTRWLNEVHLNDSTLVAGDTVNLIGPATHSYTITPTITGGSGSVITLQAEPGQEAQGPLESPKTSTPVEIDGASTRANGIVFNSGINHWNVSGIRVTGHTGNGVTSGGTPTNHAFANMRIDNNAGNVALFMDGSVSLLVNNCEIDNNGTADTGGDGIKISDSDLATIQYCSIHDNKDDGIHAADVTNLVVEFCKIHSQHTDATLHEDALDILNGGDTITVRYCTIYDFTQGMYPVPDATGGPWAADNIFFYGNVLYSDKADSVSGIDMALYHLDANARLAEFQNIQIFSNTFGFAGQFSNAVTVTDADGATGDDVAVFNNIFLDCRDDITKAALDLGAGITNLAKGYNCHYLVLAEGDTGDITTNPQLVSYTGRASTGFDFHLQSGSPCIGAGHPDLGSVVTVPATFLDRDGVVRNSNSGTIGAYEFVAASLTAGASMSSIPAAGVHTIGVAGY